MRKRKSKRVSSAKAAKTEYSIIVEGENDGICDGEYWVEDASSPYKWVKNPNWTEPSCDYERVQEALDNHPGGKIILSGTFDFNGRNVAIMHDDTEIHGDGTAAIKNGANSITVGHIRHDIQYHFTDPDQWDNHKIVRNVTISNIRFENSLQTAIFIVAHDGESYIVNNEFVGGRITAENVCYHNHAGLGMVLIVNVPYRHNALKGIVNVDNNYIDGQWCLDPNGHKYWYHDRPDLTFNGINMGIVNGFTGATLNASNNIIKNVGVGIMQILNETDSLQLSNFTNNKIDVINGPYASAGILIWLTLPTRYIITNNDITVDYKPELDFATYPEWGTDSSAEYPHAGLCEGIHIDTPHWMDNGTIIAKNTTRVVARQDLRGRPSKNGH